jgi:pentatricopeptide repeat protein
LSVAEVIPVSRPGTIFHLPAIVGGIMDHSRVLLVPFTPTCLILAGIVSVLLTFFAFAGMYGILGTFILQVWIFKYCYVLIEHLANGRAEPPVLSTEMLSPFEIRPWVQAAIIVTAIVLCGYVGGRAAIVLAAVFVALLPASIATLGVGERPWQAVNPLTLFRVIRGLGPYYLALLAALALYIALSRFIAAVAPFALLSHLADLLLEISYFALIGGALWFRRRQLGYEPELSPERSAARAENERTKLRAKMLDDVFQQVRLGKHVEATRPLADWMRDLDGDYASRDALHVAEQALRWDSVAALNPIGSTLIRHLLRAGRPDAALGVFRLLRGRSRGFTMDSADDLRTLAEYADASGMGELAASMRMETPVFHPRR